MKKILLILIMLLLVACTEDKKELETLDTPTNIILDGSIIKWDEVKNATKYKIVLNNEILYTNETYIQIDEEGIYDIIVTAMANSYNDSISSDKFSFQISYVNVVKFQIQIEEENKLIKWNVINDSVSYNVYINDKIFSSITNSYSYEDQGSGLLVVRIQGVYPIGETNLSESILIENNIEDNITLNYQYSTNSTKNILLLNHSVEDFKITNRDGNLINNSLVIEESSILEIKSEYILSLKEDNVSFHLYSNTKKYTININMNNKTVPYIISSSVNNWITGQDLMIQFELFGEEINQLTHSNLKNEDYLINDDIVIFKSSFIDLELSSNDSIEISYVINGDSLVIGLIVIK